MGEVNDGAAQIPSQRGGTLRSQEKPHRTLWSLSHSLFLPFGYHLPVNIPARTALFQAGQQVQSCGISESRFLWKSSLQNATGRSVVLRLPQGVPSRKSQGKHREQQLSGGSRSHKTIKGMSFQRLVNWLQARGSWEGRERLREFRRLLRRGFCSWEFSAFLPSPGIGAARSSHALLGPASTETTHPNLGITQGKADAELHSAAQNNKSSSEFPGTWRLRPGAFLSNTHCQHDDISTSRYVQVPSSSELHSTPHKHPTPLDFQGHQSPSLGHFQPEPPAMKSWIWDVTQRGRDSPA